jgi:tape measure domain-containing protein
LATIRELITVLGFQVNESGLKQYEDGLKKTLNTVKNTAIRFGAVMGIEIAAASLKDFANTVRAANRMQVQIAQSLAPGTDVQATLNEIFNIAQRTGQEYSNVGERFRAMLITTNELNISQDYALGAVENIQKALDVGRQSAEQQAAAFDRINMALRRGVLSERQFGELLQNAPIVVRTLGEALGRSTAEMRKLAKDGKITSEVLLKAFARTSATLDDDFSKVPLSIGQAFNYAYNEMIRVGQYILKSTNFVNFLARSIVWLTRVIVSFGERFIDAVGGADNALKILGITLIALFGPAFVSMLATATLAVYSLGVAGALAAAKFALIAASVAAILLIFEDIYAWTQGRKSITGLLLGPFEGFENLFAPFRGIKKIFEGDWTGGLADLSKAFTSVQAGMALLVGGAFIVKLGFMAWNFLKFVGLIGSIGKIAEAAGNVSKAAGGAGGALQGLNKIGFGGLIASIKAALPFVTALAGGLLAAGGIWLERQAQEKRAATIAPEIQKAIEEGSPLPTVQEMSAATELHPFQAREAMVASGYYKADWGTELLNDTKRAIQDALPEFAKGFVSVAPKIAEEQRTALVEAPKAGVSWLPDWMQWAVGGKTPMPDMPPGAMTPTNVSNQQTVNNNVPVTNNISVTASAPDLASITSTVSSLVDDATNRMITETARGLTQAMPRTEAATQS